MNIQAKLKEIINEIFDDSNTLSDYEKRKKIYEYLCKNIQYDFELLDKIKNKRVRRNLPKELINVIYNKKGVCNAIAQLYKLLLEQVNIYSICFICNDSTSVAHQLNLVYDKDNDYYSFDDVTNGIINQNNKYFNYNLEQANEYNQGTHKVLNDYYWVSLPSSIINMYIDSKSQFYLQFERCDEIKYDLPNNIKQKNNSYL